MKLVIGPASQKLGRSLARELNVEPVELAHKTFPDGESYFRVLGDVTGHVVLVQGTHPPQDVHIFQLALLSHGLKELGADRLTLVIPYLAYGRQDRAFLKGEVVSLRALIRLLRSFSVDHVVTVNPHAPWALVDDVVTFEVLDAVPLLCEHVKDLIEGPAVVVSPGKKGSSMSETAASMLSAKHLVARSVRDPMTGQVEVTIEVSDLSGYEVIAIDDLISTGGTMVKLVSAAKRLGARKVIVACIHGLFVDNADSKVLEAGADAIISTDTVDSKYSVVSVAKLIAEAIKRLTG